MHAVYMLHELLHVVTCPHDGFARAPGSRITRCLPLYGYRRMDIGTSTSSHRHRHIARPPGPPYATDDKKKAILLSTCGAETYQLIRSLVAPQKPTEKPLSDIVQLVRDHHSPPPSAIVQRFRFHSRTQKEGETVAEFIADLRKLSEHCKFADTLDDMLRDRLVCGIRDARIQRRLLAEPDLTFKKAFDLAQASETAEKNSKQLHQQPSPQAVHALSRPRNPTRQHNTVLLSLR